MKTIKQKAQEYRIKNFFFGLAPGHDFSSVLENSISR